MLTIPIRLLHADAKIPTQAREWDAGYDLCCLDRIALYPGERALIKTGISVAIPQGYYGRILPRSGLAIQSGIDVLAGVIDAGYRGEIGVVLLNTDKHGTWEVEPGTKIAQLVIQRCENVQFNVADTLPETARGAGGFGSTGA